MLELEILIWKRFGAIDAGTTGAIAIEKVSPLDHKVLDLADRFYQLLWLTGVEAARTGFFLS